MIVEKWVPTWVGRGRLESKHGAPSKLVLNVLLCCRKDNQRCAVLSSPNFEAKQYNSFLSAFLTECNMIQTTCIGAGLVNVKCDVPPPPDGH